MAASASGCPSAEDLERLLSEELSDTDRTAVEAHVETCADCQQRLERLVTPTAQLTRPPACLTTSNLPQDDASEAFLNRLRQIPPPSAEAGSFAADSGPRWCPIPAGAVRDPEADRSGRDGAVYEARHRELDKVVAPQGAAGRSSGRGGRSPASATR